MNKSFNTLLLNYWSRKLVSLLLRSDVDNSNIVNDQKGYCFQSTRHRFHLVKRGGNVKKEKK